MTEMTEETRKVVTAIAGDPKLFSKVRKECLDEYHAPEVKASEVCEIVSKWPEFDDPNFYNESERIDRSPKSVDYEFIVKHFSDEIASKRAVKDLDGIIHMLTYVKNMLSKEPDFIQASDLLQLVGSIRGAKKELSEFNLAPIQAILTAQRDHTTNMIQEAQETLDKCK